MIYMLHFPSSALDIRLLIFILMSISMQRYLMPTISKLKLEFVFYVKTDVSPLLRACPKYASKSYISCASHILIFCFISVPSFIEISFTVLTLSPPNIQKSCSQCQIFFHICHYEWVYYLNGNNSGMNEDMALKFEMHIDILRRSLLTAGCQ